MIADALKSQPIASAASVISTVALFGGLFKRLNCARANGYGMHQDDELPKALELIHAERCRNVNIIFPAPVAEGAGEQIPQRYRAASPSSPEDVAAGKNHVRPAQVYG